MSTVCMVSGGPASLPSSASGVTRIGRVQFSAHEAAQLARGDRVVDAEARADVVAAEQRAREHDDLAVVLEAHLRLGRQRPCGGGHAAGHRERRLGPAHVDDSRGESRVARVKVHGLEVSRTGCHHTRSSVVDPRRLRAYVRAGLDSGQPMAQTPDLFVVCKNCGSEVSPYITECPYCGTRLRKRAPKIERDGDRPSRAARSAQPPAPRLPAARRTRSRASAATAGAPRTRRSRSSSCRCSAI